jgi:4-hydroxy-tetrahydrodipicolinate synthase
MPTETRFSGVLTAIATPFTRGGALDLPAFDRILAVLQRGGTQGVVVNGTTGECPTLTEAERNTLVKAALAHRTESFRVYVGTGTNDTRTTIETSLAAAALRGAAGQSVDGVMAVVPYYNKPTQAGLTAHYSALAEALGVTPLCLYNVPGRSGIALAPSTAIKLFERYDNIVAIKEAAGNLGVVTELARGLEPVRARRGGGVEILSGDDPTFAPALLCGATGVISVTSHLIPKAMVGMLRAARAGDFSTLARLHAVTYPLNTELFCASNPIALKWALARMGLCENTLRLPMSPLEEAEQARVAAALAALENAGVELLA